MPSKGSRGRGRGRGGSGSEARSSTADLPVEDELLSNSSALTSTLPSESQANVPMLASIFQQQDLISPNISPVSAPTETPASTPVKAPAQRLDSLEISGQGAVTTGRGTGRAMAGKFKPKAVRRGAEERAQAEAEERGRREEREKALLREHDAALKGPRGGRGGMVGGRGIRGRGRGDAMGKGGFDRNKSLREATGVFSIAPARSIVKPVAIYTGDEGRQVPTASDGGVSATRITTLTSASSTKATTVKQEVDANKSIHDSLDTPEIKKEIPEPIYPEEQEGNEPAPRIDIEQINLITDDEDDDLPKASNISKNKGKGRSVAGRGGLKPVRLQRAEHKDRITMVNTESAAAYLVDRKNSIEDTSISSVFTPQDDEEQEEIRNDHDFYRDGKLWSGAWQDQEVHVKADPEETIDTWENNGPLNTDERNTSPKSFDEGILDENDETSSIKASDNLRAPWKSKHQGMKPVLQSEEDQAEYDRHLEDIRILTEELGGMQRSSVAENNSGMTDLEQGDGTTTKDKEGRLYLFQFPPLLPPLINTVKKEEVQRVNSGMVQSSINKSTASHPIDLTNPDNELDTIIKTEDGLSNGSLSKVDLVMEEGSIGKLIVKKSGKVELDWGGTILKLGRGVETTFLTTTIIVDSFPQQPLEEVARFDLKRQGNMIAGTGIGMGKVMGKFVATPDFSQMLGLD